LKENVVIEFWKHWTVDEDGGVGGGSDEGVAFCKGRWRDERVWSSGGVRGVGSGFRLANGVVLRECDEEPRRRKGLLDDKCRRKRRKGFSGNNLKKGELHFWGVRYEKGSCF